MTTLPIEEKRIRVLLGLYQLHTTVSPHVDVEELEKLADVGGDYYEILRYLGANGKGWLKKSNLVVRITPEGIDKAEEIIKMQMEQKMKLVLKKIYDMSGPSHSEEVNYMNLIQELSQEYGMNRREVDPILRDFEDNRGWLGGGSDECVCITPDGVLEIENPKVQSRGGDTYQTHIHGSNYGGIQQGGQGNIQNVNLTNNQAISEILPKLAELINAIRATNFEDKDEVVRDLERVQQLAQSDDPKSKWSLIQSKLTSAKAAMEIVGFAYNSLPYWPIIWKFFHG